jgi:hypothetical protein
MLQRSPIVASLTHRIPPGCGDYFGSFGFRIIMSGSMS